ncbi:MAG TPA: hypothetical protein VG897_09990 [Terriglobales bacterium]|nr:hypothetical protein [Terriglobales bacterium]
MHSYTNEDSYRQKADKTLQVFAGLAEQVGIFAGTYGIAAVHLFRPHTQVVVVGNDRTADELYAAAIAPFALNKSVVRLRAIGELPPALVETVSALPGVKEGKPVAVVCSNFTCLPPISDPDGLAKLLHETLSR